LELKFDKDKITKLASEIFAALDRLREIAALPKEAFLADLYKIAATKYFLVISIEAAIDVCNHVISRNKLRVPEDYADTFNVMGEVGAFEEDFVDRLSKMARFRNRLVHIYWEVDDELVYSILGEHIKDMERFTESIMVFLSGKRK